MRPQPALDWLATLRQTLPSQQPAQLAGLQLGGGGMQAPEDEHTRVWLQAWQLEPPAPHCEAPWFASGTQVLPLQQPLQLAELQVGALLTHWPCAALHVWLLPHA